MHKSFFFLPCCFLLGSLISSSVLAQTSTQNQSKIVFQNNQAQFQIKSKNTGHDYLIQIYKPPVAPPQQGYPVLYILDGNATFPSAANIAQSIGAGSAKLGLDPLMIVAVGYPQQKTFDVQKRAYDYTPKPSAEFQAQGKYKYGGADKFINFLNDELKPEIAKQFPVNSQQQSLYGHSFGGLLVLYHFFQKPDAFQRYFAASPSLWFDQGMLFKKLDHWQSQKQSNSPMLLTTVGTHEQGGPRTQLDNKFNETDFFKALENKRSDQFTYWHFYNPAEQHITNLYASLPKALMFASCKDLESCKSLFDGPFQQPAK
ncbi:alpha/beta hydrolase-fold protein [Acinetobacter sp. IRS14]|uniref:alpha/beta hydrolase n=1 Tax=Acinetobacter sp. IRS14 TaxID=2983398 RepID=UPI002AFE841B|nr:alpha/beta hydrolase-fold protein [Acinetobacter sp. IRS14]MEA1228517.1 alpha/beta hydrolase-fold protein [Acinetobacter sp. IRS14]